MKIKKTKVKSTRFFELHLIKSRTYEQSFKKNTLKNLQSVNLINIMLNFKKAMHIIFKYHKNNKRILFVGVPQIIETKLNLMTKHIAVPNSFNIQGLFLNKSMLKGITLKQQLLKNTNYLLSKINNKPDLIVVFNEEKDQQLVKEGYIARIPVIKFNNNLQEKYWKHSYDIPGNIRSNNSKTVDNIFFIILNAILKRSKATNGITINSKKR
jgi:ribosomal protein S2